MKQIFRCSLAALFALGLASCDSSSGPAILRISGHYEGSLVTHTSGAFQQASVRTDIVAPQDAPQDTSQDASDSSDSPQYAAPQYVMKDASGITRLTLTFDDLTDSGVSVQSSLIVTQPMTLTLQQSGPQQGCYSAKADLEVTLCATAPEITFDIADASGKSILSLVLYRFSPDVGGAGATNAPTQEQPQVFTLTAAIERARETSFQAKIEFEHVIQAKDLANAAYLHLIPQITLGTVSTNLQPAFSSVLQSIGDLAPFLLPSRWLQANEASDDSQVEEDAEKLMRLDMGSQIEGLFYTYDRDRRSLAAYVATAVKVTSIRDDVQKREADGQLPVGSTDNMSAVLENFEDATRVFNQVLAEDRAAISQALGFFDPLAVQDAQIDNEEIPIDNAPSVDFQTVNDAALSRSFELDQMDWLISAAKLAKISEYFDWLDPASDPGLGLGIALPSQIDVAQSQVNQLGIERDQVKSIISEKAFNAVTDYKEALDSYSDATDNMTLHTRRLNETLSQMDAGQKIEIATLMEILNDYIGEQVELEDSRADYRVARAEIDRLLLQGYYAKFGD